MRPLLGRRLMAVLMGTLPLPVMAAPDAYVSGFDVLYRLDLATAQATPIGNGIGFNDVEGLAIAPDGTLYGVADGTVGDGSPTTDFLIRIDTTTGVGTLVGQLKELAGVGPWGQLDYGLAFTCDGRLWASSDTTGLLWEINPSNAAVREIGNTNAPLSGLAGWGHALYGIGVQNVNGDRARQALYRINPDTAASVRIGSLNINDTLSSSGADFDANGRLWATLDSQPPEVNRATRLARINLDNGSATVVGSINGIVHDVSVRGMAIAPPRDCNNAGGIGAPAIALPIPGPATPALILLGLAAGLMGARRLRR